MTGVDYLLPPAIVHRSLQHLHSMLKNLIMVTPHRCDTVAKESDVDWHWALAQFS